MIAVAVGLVFYSIVIIVGTWMIARRPAKTMTPGKVAEVVNAQQEALQKTIADQHKTLEAIKNESDHLTLGSYINSHQGPTDPPVAR